MDLQELLEIKPQIEATKTKDGLGVKEREFAWLYKPGQPLIYPHQQNYINAVLCSGPVFTDITAIIHNHPKGNIFPSYIDIERFLGDIIFNNKLRSSLIASTESGEVSGYFIMIYTGKQAEAAYLERKLKEDDDFQILKKRTVIGLLPQLKITERLFPMPRYKFSFESWKFEKDN